MQRETALGLYKGLGAVLTGIVPKMAIRFTSYDWYKQMLADKDGMVSSKSTFMGTSKTLLILYGKCYSLRLTSHDNGEMYARIATY